MLPQTARPQAVHLASRWGWYDQAIAYAAQQRFFNDYELLYPRPFDREVRAAAQLSGLPEELIYSVMRQESLYRAMPFRRRARAVCCRWCRTRRVALRVH